MIHADIETVLRFAERVGVHADRIAAIRDGDRGSAKALCEAILGIRSGCTLVWAGGRFDAEDVETAAVEEPARQLWELLVFLSRDGFRQVANYGGRRDLGRRAPGCAPRAGERDLQGQHPAPRGGGARCRRRWRSGCGAL